MIVLRTTGTATLEDRGATLGLSYEGLWTCVLRASINVDAYLAMSDDEFEGRVRDIVDGCR